MLLNFSEAFFENEQGVEWVRGMMLADPHPQPPEAFIRQLEAVRPPRRARAACLAASARPT